MTSVLGSVLAERVRRELLNLPVEHWSQFFPVQLALWRFLEEVRPGALLLERAGFDHAGPYFVGSGADWFVRVLWDDKTVNLAAAILEPVVIHLKALPSHPLGLVNEDRLPSLDAVACADLAALVCARVDADRTKIPTVNSS